MQDFIQESGRGDLLKWESTILRPVGVYLILINTTVPYSSNSFSITYLKYALKCCWSPVGLLYYRTISSASQLVEVLLSMHRNPQPVYVSSLPPEPRQGEPRMPIRPDLWFGSSWTSQMPKQCLYSLFLDILGHCLGHCWRSGQLL